MNDYFYLYQHIPERINPFVIKGGSFAITWYSIMYLAGFLMVYVLVRCRINMGEWDKKSESQNQNPKSATQNLKPLDLLTDFLIYSFVGLLIGARLGEVLFYNFRYYLANPASVISPFDPVTHEFIGIYGMSYHGGLIGVIVAVWIWTKRNKIDFWQWANFISPAVPAGYFFGRIGNFINGELYGKATEKPWGMYFPRDKSGFLRHPSQLYEAALEGVLLFLFLWLARNKKIVRENALALYIVGYALARFIAEFFRESDGQTGLNAPFLTLGQVFSLIMLAGGLIILIKKKKIAIIKSK